MKHFVVGFTSKPSIELQDQEAKGVGVQVEKQAREDARRNQPATNATGLSASEQGVMDYGQGRLRQLSEWAGNQRRACEAQWQRLRDQLNPARLRSVLAETQTEMARVTERFRLPLSQSWQQERQADRDYKAFRNENRLNREPHYPESLLLLYASLGVAIILEGAINAWAFSEVSAQGWLGGLQAAMVLAAVNVLAGYAAGNALRGCNHVRWLRKGLAGLALGAYAAFLFVYTLLVGHYRTALLLNPETAATEGVLHLVQMPWAIYEFNSLILMVCSVGFALLALLAGYRSSDPYPGYAAIHRHYREAQARLEQVISQYYSSIDAVYQRAPVVLEQRLAEAREARFNFSDVIVEVKRLANTYKTQVAALQSTCQSLIRRYRQVNEAVRNDQAPTYFAEAVQPFAPSEVLNLEESLVEAEKLAATFPQLAKQLEEEAATIRQQLLEQHQQALQEAATVTGKLLMGQSGGPALPPRLGPPPAPGVGKELPETADQEDRPFHIRRDQAPDGWSSPLGMKTPH